LSKGQLESELHTVDELRMQVEELDNVRTNWIEENQLNQQLKGSENNDNVCTHTSY